MKNVQRDKYFDEEDEISQIQHFPELHEVDLENYACTDSNVLTENLNFDVKAVVNELIDDKHCHKQKISCY